MLEWLKLDPQTYIYIYIYIYIYLESVSPWECLKYNYMATPLSEFKKMSQKMVLLPGEKNGGTGLKLGMPAQLDSANNMGWVPSGHTSSSLCVWLKMPKCNF